MANGKEKEERIREDTKEGREDTKERRTDIQRGKGKSSTRDNFANDLSDKCVEQEGDGASRVPGDYYEGIDDDDVAD